MSSELIRNVYGLASNLQAPSGVMYAGIELEIESIREVRDSFPSDRWRVETDGSLRNEGREFISQPLPVDKLLADFEVVHKALRHYQQWPKFTDRTSIHVHINCLDLLTQQVRSIVLWYALFEPLFFELAHPSRRNNIHAVGLDQTMLSQYYSRSLPIMKSKWSKYTALNLLPLGEYGTIEFRHMEGHDDVARFKEWLLLIERLWKFGQNTLMTRDQVNNESVLKAFDYIFGPTSIGNRRGVVLELCADSLIDLKLSF